MHPSLGIPKILNRKFAPPAICSDGASLNDKFIIKNDFQTITNYKLICAWYLPQFFIKVIGISLR